MSTRSRIGVLHLDGSIDSVYCHFDGYIEEGVGETLYLYHNNLDDAKAIVALGDLSALDVRLNPDPNVKHSFDNRAEGVTVAYGRDRGETGVEAQHSKDIRYFFKACDSCDAEYAYLYSEEKKQWISWDLYAKEEKSLEKIFGKKEEAKECLSDDEVDITSVKEFLAWIKEEHKSLDSRYSEDEEKSDLLEDYDYGFNNGEFNEVLTVVNKLKELNLY